jgi:hypothetical protein
MRATGEESNQEWSDVTPPSASIPDNAAFEFELSTMTSPEKKTLFWEEKKSGFQSDFEFMDFTFEF